jgi:FMN phosphatase YigB (HAD superfamily)
MMSIKAVIWDLGGVIVRTEDPTHREKLASDIGITRQHLEQLVFAGEKGEKAQRGEITWFSLEKRAKKRNAVKSPLTSCGSISAQNCG